jgi:glutathione synthase
MKLVIMVNSVDDLLPSMTTAMLAARAAARGDEVYLVGVDDVFLAADNALHAIAVAGVKGADVAEFLRATKQANTREIALERCDALMIRTNPARDPHGAHDTALLLARLARDRGLVVVNDPEGLMRARSKLYLSELSASYRPETVISRSAEWLSRHVRARGRPTVLKPLAGSRGRDVFIVDGSSPNLRGMADVVTRDDYGVAQSLVPGAEKGDTRVVVLEGEILEIDGHPAAIRRVPASGDFRSNLHAGGRAERAIIAPIMREAVAALAPLLRRDGLFLVGVDFIVDQIIEVNVFSTGGLRDAERFSGRDFCEAILAALQRRLEQRT